MADAKISALVALTGADVQPAADVLPIVDNSVTTTKKILVGELAISMGATQAQQEASTSNSVFATPSVQQYHPSSAKAWGQATVSGTTLTQNAGYNCTLSRTGVGTYTATWGTDFSSANYCVVAVCVSDRSVTYVQNYSAGEVDLAVIRTVDNSASEAAVINVVAYGDQ